MINLYQIIFLGGTAGNFIEQLLSMIISGSTTSLYISSGHGAHRPKPINNYRCHLHKSYYTDHLHNDNAYNYISRFQLSKDVILLDHAVPVWKELFKLYPYSKNIIITVPDKKLVPRISGNLFFKTICNAGPNDPSWVRLKEKHFPMCETPFDVPKELLELYLKSMEHEYSNVYVPPFDGSVKYNDERIINISYYDILYNGQVVLEQLSNLTKKTLPECIETEYQKYLDAQDELVRAKMPWINDR